FAEGDGEGDAGGSGAGAGGGGAVDGLHKRGHVIEGVNLAGEVAVGGVEQDAEGVGVVIGHDEVGSAVAVQVGGDDELWNGAGGEAGPGLETAIAVAQEHAGAGAAVVGN